MCLRNTAFPLINLSILFIALCGRPLYTSNHQGLMITRFWLIKALTNCEIFSNLSKMNLQHLFIFVKHSVLTRLSGYLFLLKFNMAIMMSGKNLSGIA